MRRVLIVGLVLSLGLFLLVRFLPLDGLARKAVAELESKSGLAIDYESSQLNLFPLGLKLTGLHVQGRPLGGGSVDSLDVHAPSLVARASLTSLFRRQPEVQELRLQDATAELWLVESEELPVEGATPSDESEAGLPPNAALGLLALENAHLAVHQPDGTILRIGGMHQEAALQLQDGRLSGEVSLRYASLAVHKPEVDAQIMPALVASLSLDFPVAETGQGRITLLSLESGGLHAEGGADLHLLEGSRQIDGKFELSAALAELQEGWRVALRSTADSSERLPLTLDGGTARGTVLVKGAIPEGAEDPAEAWLALLSGSGRVEQALAQLHAPPLELRFHSDWELGEGKVRLPTATLNLEGLEATGSLAMPATGEGSLQGRLQVKGDLRQLRATVARSWPDLADSLKRDLPGPEEWPGMAGLARVRLDLDLPLPPPATVEEWPAGALKFELDPLGLSFLPKGWRDSLSLGQGIIVGRLDAITRMDFPMAGPGFEGRLDGRVEGLPENPRLVGTTRFSSLNLDQFTASTAPADAQGWMSMGVGVARAAQPPAAPPENFGAELSFRADEVLSKGYRLEAVSGQLALASQVLKVRDLRARLGQADVAGVAGADWTALPPVWSLSAKSDSLRASDLLGPVAPKLAAALDSRLASNIALSAPLGASPEELRASIGGAVSILGNGGVLATTEIFGEKLATFMGSSAADWKQLRFGGLNASLQLDQGKVLFNNLRLSGKTDVEAAGWVGLDGRCDYRLRLRLPKGSTPALGALAPFADRLRDADGRLAFVAHLSGPVGKPKVEIDLGQLEERLRGSSQDKIRSELDRLFPGGKGPTSADAAMDSVKDLMEDRAAAVRDSIRRALEEKAKEGLRGLLGGKKKGGGVP